MTEAASKAAPKTSATSSSEDAPPPRPTAASINESEVIDRSVFDQLLEMDEEDEEEEPFSRSIVNNYFTQAQTTFDKMDAALKDKDLVQLSQLGHFLKGSSAAMGLIKVKESCEKMQHYGNKKDEGGEKDITEQQALDKLTPLIKQLKTEYTEAEVWLKDFYEA